MSVGHTTHSKSRRAQKRRLSRRERGLCFWCGTRVSIPKGVRDHVVPLRYGGEDTLYNMVFSCRECDQARSQDVYTEREVEELRQMMTNYLQGVVPGWELVATRPNGRH